MRTGISVHASADGAGRAAKASTATSRARLSVETANTLRRSNRSTSTPATPEITKYGSRRPTAAALNHPLEPVWSYNAFATATIPSDCAVPAAA